jgi:hypothetical protein
MTNESCEEAARRQRGGDKGAAREQEGRHDKKAVMKKKEFHLDFFSPSSLSATSAPSAWVDSDAAMGEGKNKKWQGLRLYRESSAPSVGTASASVAAAHGDG